MRSVPRLLLAAVVLATAWAAAAPLAAAPNGSLVAVLVVTATSLVLVRTLPAGVPCASAGVVGTALLVAVAHTTAPPSTGAWTVLVAAAAACGLPAAAVFALSLAALAAAWGPWSTGDHVAPLDAAAAAVSAGWGVLVTARLGLSAAAWWERRYLETRLARAAARLDADVGALETVGARLAGPHGAEGGPRVWGQGADEQRLALASDLDGGRVLVGVLDGPPLATWTAAWILRAHAIAGGLDEVGLFRISITDLDEILAGTRPRWLGIWDRGKGRLSWVDATGAVHCDETSEVIVGRDHPGGEPCHWSQPPPPGFVPPPRPPPEPPAAPVRQLAALAGGVVVSALVGWPSVGLLAWTAWHAAGGIWTWARGHADAAAFTLHEVLDARAELRSELARLHGATLLPEVGNGAFEATAHRLRGERLDSTFVDVFLDAERRLCAVSGELAGRGVLDRFAATHLAIVARHAVEDGAAWDRLVERVREESARETATLFGGPPRFVLGMAALDAAGRLSAHGTLAHMVVADEDGVRIAAEASLGPRSVVYCCPATVRPGPGEIAPPVRPAAVAERTRAILADRVEGAEGISMPDLFARVFDGEHAPASGTLVRFRRVRRVRRSAAA